MIYSLCIGSILPYMFWFCNLHMIKNIKHYFFFSQGLMVIKIALEDKCLKLFICHDSLYNLIVLKNYTS